MRCFTFDWGFILGNNSLREVVGDVVTDATPYIYRSGSPSPVSLSDVCLTSGERLLGWSSEEGALIIRDEFGWQMIDLLTSPTASVLNGVGPAQFVNTSQNGLLLFGPSFLARIDLGGETP